MARNRWGWLAVLAPVLLCLPCLAVPVLALGGAATLSGVGGAVTGNARLAVLILLFGHGLAAVLLARRWRRRTIDACCSPARRHPDLTQDEADEAVEVYR
jgi:membrane protein implicated in regulation of membrane protease activity